MDRPLRLLILGAHPDDAEFHAGGIAALYRQLGHVVRMVSVTDGGAGHHFRPHDELVAMRRSEAAAAAVLIGAQSAVWSFPDGHLEPTLELRHAVIRELRTFAPDLVLTHRTSDYHPDHRALAQAVQDASYMVTVPRVVPECEALVQDPVVAFLPDLFTRPCPLRADVVLDVDPWLDTIIAMLACHRSQMFEFLPHNLRLAESLPAGETERIRWLGAWYGERARTLAERFRDATERLHGSERAATIERVEAFEISEYARPLNAALRRQLFPFLP